MFSINVKKYIAEIILVLSIGLSGIVLHCLEFHVNLEALEKLYSLCLQIVTGILGLYFTAFTIFIGLGLSPRKLDVSKIRLALSNKGLSEEDVSEIIEERVISPYKDSLTQASLNFKESIFVMVTLSTIAVVIYGCILISQNSNNLSCSPNCASIVNSFLFSYILMSTIFLIYLIYDSAKFLVKIRKFI